MVTTNVRVDGAWRPVTTWDLTHTWRDPGDGTGRFLWLSKIGRLAHGQPGTGDDVRFDPVTFSGGQQLPSRVNDTISDGYPEMNRIRVTGITTETGGTIGIEYTPAQCTRSSHPVPSDWKIPEATQRDNTSRCFPMTWTPWGEKQRTEWFHTYLVKTITQSPGQDAALGPQVRTTCAYSGGMAWAKVDDPLVAKKDRTWSEMRGYETVTTTTGSGDADKVSARYLRGMGETLTLDPALTSRDVTDDEVFAGQTLVTTTYNGDTPVSKSVTVPTATEVARTGSSGAGDLLIASRLSRADTYTGIYDASGSLEHVTRTDASYNTYGQVTSVDDHGAWSANTEQDDTTDDQCTRTTYLVAEAEHLVVPKDTESVSVACGTTPTRPDDVVTAVRYAYDDQAYGTAPTDGLVTQTTLLDPKTGTFTGDSPVSSASYDQRGRPTSATDALGRVTSTAYTESAGVLTRVTTTSPDPDGPGDGDGITLTPHTQTTTLDPVVGLPVTVTDANGRDTKAAYDAAGRLTSVTYPDRVGKTPNITYAYTTSARGINTITTRTLAADGTSYHAVVELFDGQLRPIQVQTESLDGHTDATIGRLVVDTQYDDLGRVRQTTSPWYTTGRPAASLVAITTVPDATTRYTYDAAGRTTAEILYLGNPDNPDYEAWRTKTVYDGTTTTVIPPAGGVPTQTITDARGRPVTMRQYLRDPQDDAAADTLAEIVDLASQDTTYRYDHAGRIGTIADTADNEWTYEYDWLGRQIKSEDPDAGPTTTTYDKAGQVTAVDHEMGDLRYTYDQLGRRTSMRYGWQPDKIRSRWFYDVLHAQAGPKAGQVVKGQMTASSRFDFEDEYVTATTGFDAAYRPTGEVTVIPDTAANEGLAGRYETSATYTADGQVASVTYGAAGNLNKETVTTHYNKASAPEWMGGGFGWGTYVATSRHDVYGRLSYLDLGNTYGTVVSYLYQDGTNRLTNMRLDRERIGGTELDLRYTYDAVGNVTSIKDKPTALGRVGDQQCFQYDALRQLTEAWTPATGNCGLAKSIPWLGGAAPYWQSFEYDSIGNRTTQTYRTPGGEGDGLVTTSDYSYDGPRDKNNDGDTTDLGEYAGPHSATQIETTGPDGDVRVDIGYDAAGGMYEQATTTDYASVVRKTEFYMERELRYTYVKSTLYPEPEPGSGDDDSDGDQTDDPAPAPGTGVTTHETTLNLYTADGERLTRTSPDGSVTAYVGGQEVTRSASGQVTATRYYAFAGQSVAMRTANGLGGVTTLVNDHHGTPVASVHNTNWTTSSVDKHYTLPFGTARGGATTPGDHEFLGKTEDATTGLTNIGARWYDDLQGRFLTVDPLLDPANPQMLNAYAYANNNPTTFSDPTGLLVGPLIDGDYKLTQQANKAFQNPVKAPNTSWAPPPVVPPQIAPPVTTSPTTTAGRAATQVATRAATKAATRSVPIVGVIAEMIIFAPSVADGTCPVGGCTNQQPAVTVSNGATTAIETGTVDVTPAPKDTLGGGNPGQGSNGKGNGGGSGTKTTFADPADDEGDGADGRDDPLEGDSEYVDLYKAPARGSADRLFEKGFSEADFPGAEHQFPDGRAYFGVGGTGRDIALDYASRGNWDSAIIRVRIPRGEFKELWGSRSFVSNHNGVPNSEVSIPNTMFDALNKFPRTITWLE